MFKILSVLIFGVALAAGFRSEFAVNPIDICGGNGVFLELRVRDCTTPPCVVVVNEEDYDIEVDFIPLTPVQEVTVLLSLVLRGLEVVILQVPLPDSALEAGTSYTIAYLLTPDEVLVGGTFNLKYQITDSSSEDPKVRPVIVCVRAPVTVINP